MPGTMTHAGRAASSPEIFRPFLTVCLTVFPFEFRPRTSTIGFYGKKSFISELMILECSFPLRGAWRDRDTNDIFAHCSFIFYFLDFKFSNFVCLSELHPLIWFFLKNSFSKKKNNQKTTQNALAPSIFIVLSIVLKLGTPLLHTEAQNTLLQNF